MTGPRSHGTTIPALATRPKVERKCAPAWGPEPGACRHFGADPDGAYCGHPESLRRTGFGYGVNRMSQEGLCTHGEKGGYQLWEGREQ